MEIFKHFVIFRFVKFISLKTWGRPSEVSPMMISLISDLSPLRNGADINVTDSVDRFITEVWCIQTNLNCNKHWHVIKATTKQILQSFLLKQTLHIRVHVVLILENFCYEFDVLYLLVWYCRTLITYLIGLPYL